MCPIEDKRFFFLSPSIMEYRRTCSGDSVTLRIYCRKPKYQFERALVLSVRCQPAFMLEAKSSCCLPPWELRGVTQRELRAEESALIVQDLGVLHSPLTLAHQPPSSSGMGEGEMLQVFRISQAQWWREVQRESEVEKC